MRRCMRGGCCLMRRSLGRSLGRNLGSCYLSRSLLSSVRLMLRIHKFPTNQPEIQRLSLARPHRARPKFSNV